MMSLALYFIFHFQQFQFEFLTQECVSLHLPSYDHARFVYHFYAILFFFFIRLLWFGSWIAHVREVEMV